ncbi:S8 family serine peptidase [Arenicella xantha]|uniref:CUB-like protein n=1 Tax=Arenicella xantha TaxID=644221 RepID=A0A395JMK7_9GAMM|nr:S8 family serine peptidase [Arenicella xantha]RBP52881.1 CUB-like protein [Arenicella xantha]
MKSAFWVAVTSIVAAVIPHGVTSASTFSDLPIVIAIVDDGFNHNHRLFQGMVWRNPGEVPNNTIDDDANGVVDDLVGWDVSDMDGTVLPAVDRQSKLYHGTFIAGVIAEIIRDQLGERDDYPIKLMFVKAVSDASIRDTVEDGYRGLDYALKSGANVVNLSWSGGLVDDQAKSALAGIADSHAFVVAAMGNHYQDEQIYPAAHSQVFAVTGVDERGISIDGNLGEEADLTAMGAETESADVASNNGVRRDRGTSIATARVSAAVALMKLARPSITKLEIESCLSMTSYAVDKLNPLFPGQFGAGALNISAAINCVKAGLPLNHTFSNPEGVLLFTKGKARKPELNWRIQPEGAYSGVVLKPFFEGKNKSVQVTISSLDGEHLWQGKADALPHELEFSSHAIQIKLQAKGRKDFRFGMRYAFKLVQLSKRYCQGLQRIEAEGVYTDGSVGSDYAHLSDCQWLVVPPEGENAQITFTKLDTELHHDIIHLFAGETTEQRNLLLKLSGRELPPPLLVKGGHPALLWFVSTRENSGTGFEFKVDYVEP